MTPLEVGRYDRSIFLLTGSVPDVKLGWFILESDVFHLEVNCGYLGILFS